MIPSVGVGGIKPTLALLREATVDKIIVYLDDAAHALAKLQPWLMAAPGQPPRQWILVACTPRVTQHVSKWVTHSARQSWRGKWADRLFAQVVPELERQGDAVLTCTGKNNLVAQTDELLRLHGPARVVDMRRPKSTPAAAPFTPRSTPGTGWVGSYLAMLSLAGLLAVE